MHTQWKSQDRAKLNRCNDGKRNKEKNMSQMTSHCNGNASHSKNSPSLSVEPGVLHRYQRTEKVYR